MFSGTQRGQQHDLRRQRRHLVPRPQAEQRKPHVREHACALDATVRAHERRRPRACARPLAPHRPGAAPSRPRSSSTDRQVHREKFAHVPSVRCCERIQAAERSVSSARRMPRNSRSSMSSASIVTFVCSSPRHHPSWSCSESRRSRASSNVTCASLTVCAICDDMCWDAREFSLTMLWAQAPLGAHLPRSPRAAAIRWEIVTGALDVKRYTIRPLTSRRSVRWNPRAGARSASGRSGA